MKAATTDPLLPALVKGLSFVHAVPVAAKVAAVPVVAKVAILVAKAAAVATSLVELQERNPVMKPRYKQTKISLLVPRKKKKVSLDCT